MSWWDEFWGRESRKSASLSIGELGAPGTQIFGGLIVQDYGAELQGRDRYAKFAAMRRHFMVEALMEAATTPITAGDWTVNPYVEGEDLDAIQDRDVEVARSVGRWLFEMPETRWKTFIAEACLGIFYGAAYFEKVFGFNAEGKVVPIKLGYRSLDSIVKWHPGKNNEFLGFWQETYGDLEFRGYIPAAKLVPIVYRPDGANFEGRGLFVPMYDVYRTMIDLQAMYLVSLQRTGSGILIGKHKGNWTEEQKARQKQIDEMYHKGKMSTLWHSSDVDIELTSIQEPSGVLDNLRWGARGMMLIMNCEFMDLGSGGNTGSFALGEIQYNHFRTTLEEKADVIREAVQKSVVERLVDINFPGAPYPTLSFGLKERNILEMAEAVNKLMGGQSVLQPGPEMYKHFHQQLNIPYEDASEDDVDDSRAGGNPEEEDQEASAAAESAAPSLSLHLGRELRSRDPTRDGSGPRRPLLAIEERYGLVEFNDRWDDFVAELVSRLENGLDLLTEGLLDKIRRALLKNQLRQAQVAPWVKKTKAAFEQRIWSQVEQIIKDTANHFARRAGLDTPAFTAAEMAVARGLTLQKLDGLIEEARSKLWLRITTDTQLLEALKDRGDFSVGDALFVAGAERLSELEVVVFGNARQGGCE